MARGYSPEQIVRKLRQAEGRLATGAKVPEVARELGISEATFHRWKNRYGGMSGLTPDERTIFAYATAASSSIVCSYSARLR